MYMRYPVEYHRLRHGRRALTLELWPNHKAGTVLFYPGTMFSPIQYRLLLSALRQNGLAVAALHLTGHGCNPHRASFCFADLLADGLEAEEWLWQHGHKELAVCGHSQGGILTLAHAGASSRLRAAFAFTGILPQQVEAIQLTRFKNFRDRASLQGYLDRLAHVFPHFPVPAPAYLSVRRICQNARQLCCNRRKGRVFYPLSFLATLLTPHVSPLLRCPLYLFNAVDDALFTPALARTTFSLLQAPAKRLIWLPGGGHLAVFDPHLSLLAASHVAVACAGLGIPLQIR